DVYKRQVESSPAAAERIGANARLNGLRLEVVRADAFEFLRSAAAGGRQFDLVVLDPPSFTHARGKLREALRGYRELHRLAAPLLAPGGILATFCCSHHVAAAEFQEAVAQGLADARRSAHVLARMGQPPDHPVALHIPESEYLKGLLLASTAAF
ncbi:MAG: class I SAM-dependent methyltransferase, partial [Terrimicrobiaceae bacterium]|nr:class I SAM-dependent methyltransferase [Terrimicrobiaceae bacterium]